jgi:predicted lipoprotein with Yx(FWY)xxD motif
MSSARWRTNLSKKLSLSLALAAVLLAGCASMGSAPPMAMKGGMLVDAKGMTLYTFDRDRAGSGKSVCNGDCAVKWPPAMAKGDDKPSGDYTIVTRDDGKRQWAFKGKPLYTWPEDQEPGDKYGDNYSKVWHIVR